MADRFISGQISALNLTRPYVAQNFPGLYRFATKYEKNCSWGWYFKVRQDNVLGGMEYTTGFVLRF
ncbi:MAG: hypothetical protein R3213_02055 [Flavobacteriaceae bacterium]|nr:hypothetical protein [Flavobacteriaceae bacterium]